MDCVISRLSLGTKNQDIEVWETSNLLIPLHPWMKKKQRGRERAWDFQIFLSFLVMGCTYYRVVAPDCPEFWRDTESLASVCWPMGHVIALGFARRCLCRGGEQWQWRRVSMVQDPNRSESTIMIPPSIKYIWGIENKWWKRMKTMLFLLPYWSVVARRRTFAKVSHCMPISWEGGCSGRALI